MLAEEGEDVFCHEFCKDVGVEGGIVPDADAVRQVAQDGGWGGGLRGEPGGKQGVGGGVYGLVVECCRVVQVYFQVEHGGKQVAGGGGKVAVAALGNLLRDVGGQGGTCLVVPGDGAEELGFPSPVLVQ